MDENNKGGKWWLWFVIPIATLTTWRLFRNTANRSNRVTEDMTDSESQAAKFFGYFGVVVTGIVVTATPVVKDSTKRLIGWLARNINDWATVQRAFTSMCGGNYTILQAASTALDTTNYTGFVTLINNALHQKRIFCGSIAYHSLYNADRYGGNAGENFAANAFVGRCTREDDKYYYYVSWQDGFEYQCDKDYFVLKN